MIESELPVCKIMFNVHVQCTMHYSLSYHLCTLSPLTSLSLPLPSFGFARSRQVKSPTKVQKGSVHTTSNSRGIQYSFFHSWTKSKVLPRYKKAQSTPQPIAEASSTASSTPGPTDMCRVQVRLPNDRVIQCNFPSSASLNGE